MPRPASILLPLVFAAVATLAQQPSVPVRPDLPPRAAQAQQFLTRRGLDPHNPSAARAVLRASRSVARPQSTSPANALWQPLGPSSVLSVNYGPVTGRVTAIAFDPADPTGNHVYLGTTGGGVWLSRNAAAANPQDVRFAPLTDAVGALDNALDSSISIGAISVQPGGTGVLLAGTGDPNDALDSYYGAGILRSTDGGATWSLAWSTANLRQDFSGEGFAGFAWSTVNPQLAVAAVAQSYLGVLESAQAPQVSYEGLYYSTDSGATWSLATIEDSGSAHIQGPADAFVEPDGNAVTSVVWNPIRRLFLAAVRYHGYYQSTDGITWTRLAAQPGAGLSAQMCPIYSGSIGSVACPIFRGTLAVNPVSGDTFAWTVDANNQDQGIWQDQCAISAGVCANQTVTFGKHIATAPLQTDDLFLGPATIPNGDYNLALAAVPSGQDTLLFAGVNDLWKCSLAAGCIWRNTTNAGTCMSAQVAGYQHALALNSSNAMQLLIGNDSGLWRSFDDVAETGPACSPSDASHFDNLNTSLGSMSEVVSMSAVTTSPYTMMIGLGVNGTAGVKQTGGPTADWPQILGGEGGPVAIDPTNNANWYVNNHAGVSIRRCAQSTDCTPAAFGAVPIVSDTDVSGDGYSMSTPAPFLVDPLDPSQLIVGTCRVWRGPADGSPWTSANAISPFLDGVADLSRCNGDALILSMAALALPAGGEIIYVGMFGPAEGGATLAGHVLSASYSPGSGAWSAWQDLTLNPVTNDPAPFNAHNFGISSIYIDPHDATGNTVYVTIAGMPSRNNNFRTAYRSTDGGAHWTRITANLPWSPASSVVVDPLDSSTVYIATDVGVYSTRQIASCATDSPCWTAYGTGLPEAPVTQLSAAPATASLSVLVAGTYGRGVWQIPLWTAGTQLTTATAAPVSLTFPSQPNGTSSGAQTVTVTNTGGIALAISAITATGDFTETDNCQSVPVSSGGACAIQVKFAPTQAGSRTGLLTIGANVAGGQLTVALSGTGQAASGLTITPAQVSFTVPAIGRASAPQTLTVTNAGSVSADQLVLIATAPFSIAQTTCGDSLAAGRSCTADIVFTSAVLGPVTGSVTVSSATFASSTASLNGFAGAAGSVQLQPAFLAFSTTGIGAISSAQTVTVTNTGAAMLTHFALTASSQFQLTNNTCAASLAAGAACTTGVVFAPSSAGPQTGTLTASSDALAASVQMPLSGTGFDFTAVVSGPTSQTVSSGQTASYTVKLTPLGGTDATFTFRCNSLPAYSVCSFNPSSPTVPGNGIGSVTAAIVTGHAVAAFHTPRLVPWDAASLACALLLLPAGLRRRRHILLFLVMLLLAVGGLSSCSGSGGGSGGGPPGGGQGSHTTPAGTYSIQVTATSNGLSHAFTLSLTVD